MNANSGLTEDDLARIRAAAQEDSRNMAYALAGDSKRSANHRSRDVSVGECALIRCMRGCGESNREIIDSTGFCEKTVRMHAVGRCEHSARVPVPPTVLTEGPYTDGFNTERTREKRREWRDERDN